MAAPVPPGTPVPPATPSRWQAVKERTDRVPLRIKLIVAVLALVIIALAVISVASINLFRSYQIRHANQQVAELFNEQAAEVRAGGGVTPGAPFYVGAYLIALRPIGFTLTAPAGSSIPDIPTSSAWLAANRGKLVNVPAVTGTDSWRVVTAPATYTGFGAQGPLIQQETLIVGVDLGDINGTIGQLAYIDLIVSAIVLVALATLGVAIVRASLRPLTDIERTAEAIAAGDLSRRVPDHDPRTEVGRLGRSLNIMLGQIESAFRARTVRGGRAPLRGADAPVRRRRQPRTAHPADRDPRLRRVLPPARRAGQRLPRAGRA